MKSLISALAKAQAEARGVEKLARNEFARFDYASAEQLIAYATEIMGGHGLALIPSASELLDSDKAATTPWVLRQTWTLLHTSGESLTLTRDWPCTTGKGKPEDKAVAGAYTASLGYLVRDVLLVPRVERGTDLDHPREEERPVSLDPAQRHQQDENAAKAARRAKAQAPAPEPRWTDNERKSFCAELKRLGLDYDLVADWCESVSRPRPSSMTPDTRAQVLAYLNTPAAGPVLAAFKATANQ